MTNMQAISPIGTVIRGGLDLIPGIAEIQHGSWEILDGKITYEHQGSTDVIWDASTPGQSGGAALAADDLLKALKALFALHEPEGRFQPSHYKPILKQARDAIEKAELPPHDLYADYEGNDWSEDQLELIDADKLQRAIETGYQIEKLGEGAFVFSIVGADPESFRAEFATAKLAWEAAFEDMESEA